MDKDTIKTSVPSDDWWSAYGVSYRWDVAFGRRFPQTRWERLKLRAQVKLDRLRDALAVLRGEKEAVDWDVEDRW